MHAGIPSWIWLHPLCCTLCFLLFCGGFLFRSCWSALLFVHFSWLCLFLLSVVEIFELSLLQMSRNVFVSLAIARCFLVFVLNEIAFGFLFLLLVFGLIVKWYLFCFAILLLKIDLVVVASVSLLLGR